MSDSCVVIQRDLDSLEKWANRNLKSNGPMHKYTQEINWLERSFMEDGFRVLVDNK